MPAVIFDVDGTLIDNSFMHAVAWHRACRDFGIDASMARLHRLVGMGGDQFVPALIGREMPELDDAHGRQMKEFEQEAPVLARAGDLLRAIRERGIDVAVATSAGRDAAQQMLERVVPEGGVVGTLVTSDDVGTSKPAPDLVAVALERAGLEPRDAVFVGDTRWDVEAAGRAGVACIGVCSGGWAACELSAAGAVTVYASVAELLDELEASPIAQLGTRQETTGSA